MTIIHNVTERNVPPQGERDAIHDGVMSVTISVDSVGKRNLQFLWDKSRTAFD